MKVDLYTKIVLTAIAIGLFLNAAKEINPPTALAQRWKSEDITLSKSVIRGILVF